MKRALRAAALLAAASMLTACAVNVSGITVGFGSRRTVRAKGEDHTEIDLLLYADTAGDHILTIEDIYLTDSAVEINIDPALEDNITLTGEKKLLDSIKVEIDHQAGIITVSGNDRLQFADADLEITLGVPVKTLTLSGGIELDAVLPEVKAFALRVDGALDGEIAFGDLDTLDVEINGAGSLELDGTCAKADITVNGAGSIEADDLRCTDADVTINGAGSCEIHVSGTLNAEVDGIGSIRYRGNPARVNQSGGGIVSVSGK
ncbi:MAG: DUF2807 domain-containing protein [Clostridia bacterium]|nr:DUF2807 domain-containing protein [Clostridia bacterium]